MQTGIEPERFRPEANFNFRDVAKAEQCAWISNNTCLTGPVIMNLSTTVDAIVELRSQGAAADERVAEYLKSTLETANIQVQTQAVSGHSRALLMAFVLGLSIVFLVGVLRRRHRMAFISALAIPLILFLELSAGLHVLTWTTPGRSENIIAHFPVQRAAQRVVVGTHYVEPDTTAPSRFAATVSAFLFPMTLVIAVLGLWRTAVYFGKFDFEDARTIALVMGLVCAIYYAIAFGTCIQEDLVQKKFRDSSSNIGSLAVIAALAEDLSQKYPRLENTWVTIVFFGHGRMDGGGAEEFAQRIAGEKGNALPTYFMGCEQAGRGGTHGYVLSDDAITKSIQSDRDLVRAVNRTTVRTTGAPLEIVRGETTNAVGFLKKGFPSIVLTTRQPANEQSGSGLPETGEIHRGQLMLTLQLLEASLSELDRPVLVGS
jgi:hypothetical protein